MERLAADLGADARAGGRGGETTARFVLPAARCFVPRP